MCKCLVGLGHFVNFVTLPNGVSLPLIRIEYFGRQRFFHRDAFAVIRKVHQPTQGQGELAIGWVAHYAVGISYAAILLAVSGLGWARHPTLVPALILSLLALAAPFFIMQPGMGAGIAASRTPNPGAARLRSVAGHTVFGVGLYGAALLLALLIPG